MATVLHEVVLERDVVLDLFGAIGVTPAIAAGVAGYIQNVSNREVQMSNSATFEAHLVIGGKIDQTSISTLTFEAGDAVFLRTTSRKATLTVAVAA